jgi:hypothetical protein
MSSILHRQYRVRYTVYPSPTGQGFMGYIYDPVSRDKSTFETYETRKKEALEQVKARIEQIFGAGKTLSDTKREYRHETIESVLQSYLENHYMTKITNRSPEKQKTLLKNKNSAINRVCRYFGTLPITQLYGGSSKNSQATDQNRNV